MCHWEIRNARKQEIFDEFSVYENFCLEIESEIHFMMDEVDDDIYSESHIARNSNDCDKLEEIRNEAEEKLEITKEKESEIVLKVIEKEKMEKQLKEKLSKIEYDEEINEIQDSFDEYIDKDYLEQIGEFINYMEENSCSY